MAVYSVSTTKLDFGTLPLSTVINQKHLSRTVFLNSPSPQVYDRFFSTSISNSIIPDLFSVESRYAATVNSPLKIDVGLWSAHLPQQNSTGTFTATLIINVDYRTNPYESNLTETLTIDLSITITDDSPSKDPKTPPPTDKPPPTCKPNPTGCPDGYTAIPPCPDPSPIPPPPGPCTPPPPTPPPPPPPTEKTVTAFLTDTDSIALYGARRGQEYSSDLIETVKQAKRVAEQLIWQSNQDVECQFSVPYNPELERGQTLRLNSEVEGVDITGIIKSTGTQFDVKSGQVVTQVVMMAPEFVMNSQIGETLDYR